MLINQDSAAPTRKMWAVLIAGALTSIVNVLMGMYVPDFATPEVLSIVGAAMMVLAGYVVKERV
ncbi:hypothetical protein LCGC14_1314600 [marine sediment metagenome]|uniref:Uncharacterized protein n=1 Tax=marine sediment metagenome TaxID=412755 RepID=A0A0F9N292_9ZZZZ